MVATLRRAPLDPRVLEGAAEMIRALGHPIRLRILECLEEGQKCPSELVEALDQPQALVSQQLARMRAAGIVRARRDGPHVWYSVADERVLRMLDCLRHSDRAPRGRVR
jgi:ArsR family transcriptional regulator